VGLCLAGIYFRIVHISHLRHKESDRLEVLKTEMAKAGYEIEIGNDSLVWTGNKKPVVERSVFDSHGDHRIAMALSVATVASGRMDLQDADAVTKSFPGFYNQIANLGII
jgi:3-phosphoshikimate 1-carboxyvinyltransferase